MVDVGRGGVSCTKRDKNISEQHWFGGIMVQERTEFFPPVEHLQEERRRRMEPHFLRFQAVLWMAQEFCRKMFELGIESQEVEFDVGPPSSGYLIPLGEGRS